MEKLFKIKHVARLLNMSSDSIRFYEKKRIVTPLRDTQNAYRGFRQEDIWRLYDCKILQSMGFSIAEVTTIMNNVCRTDYNDMLEHKETELEHQIRVYQEMLQEIRRVQAVAPAIAQSQNVCYIQDSPHLYALCYTRNGELDSKSIENKFFKTALQHYSAFLPIAIIPFKRACCERSLWENSYGFCIDAKIADEYGIATQQQVIEYLPRRSVYVLVEAKPGLNVQTLKFAYTWMAEHNLKLTGDIIGRMLRFDYGRSGATRIYEVWLPID
ncbi:MerR family transcriptional regulator [Liquorilactobacillus satsumensis]|uniref:HTH merR-type domain-containing protein n=1 Tax=Liquorilactobacillus satsumensis DSM 16230 = JCM 12392 TaxID=1423801 RepID=A0A0R1UUM7_9LACO|nr:MerR family transcriptional regulator [Liquorilactobacillus satsumensis]KRL96750.1 hypothetical protein FD50_GL002030 [Liquorilactobacillus satsumensis DSM 16230 = JCM 12392]MCC7666097.1 MerR family transcriptional regulator [Liquorilactobacillus satsumensis]MCP9312550.1 MerR family transcriptional regulator [Liquorilactobacillus satsumensis]MCP9356797.1 MerR family transcriptional regulator [Liquorilactobacillus satsumensis]MCP9360486.1 MerR family transcriptional regulator [Liquorilactoba